MFAMEMPVAYQLS